MVIDGEPVGVYPRRVVLDNRLVSSSSIRVFRRFHNASIRRNVRIQALLGNDVDSLAWRMTRRCIQAESVIEELQTELYRRVELTFR
jgi:hypothetical protein